MLILNQPPPIAQVTVGGVNAQGLVGVGRGAKIKILAGKWGFPTKPQ